MSKNETSRKLKETYNPFGQGPLLKHPTPHHGIKPAERGEKKWQRKDGKSPK